MKAIQSQVCNSFQNERGAVLILVALLTSSLVILAGLAIDSAIIANSKTQQRHSSEYIALGALKGFFESTATLNRDRLNEAILRAEKIAQSNNYLGKNMLINKRAESLDTNSNPESNSHGRLIAGKWYFSSGATQNCNDVNNDEIAQPCPCLQSDPTKWNTPCFRELDFDVQADQGIAPNAIRATLKTASDSPMRTILSGITGIKQVNFSSTSTAVKVPRKRVILTDLSSSTHSETHIPYSQLASLDAAALPHTPTGEILQLVDVGEYSYLLDEDIGTRPACLSGTPSNPCLNSLQPPLTGSPSCQFAQGYGPADSYYNFIYGFWAVGLYSPPTYENTFFTPPLRLVGETQAFHHYQEDYSCFDVVSFNDQLPSESLLPNGDSRYSENLRVLVDTYTGNLPSPSTDVYDGPEPLTTMLDGINQAATLFDDNFLLGDELTVIGFDSSAGIDIRKIGPILDDGASELTDLKTMTDISLTNQQTNPRHHQLRIAEHLFVSRLDPHLNFPEALTRAREALIQNGNDTSINQVVIVSDGVSTCYNDDDTNCLSDDSADILSKRYCRFCDASSNGFENSFIESERIIYEEYIPDGIELSFIQIGANTAPHSLLRVHEDSASGSKKCMSELEARLADPPLEMTDDSPVNGMSASDSFIALSTGLAPFTGPAKYAELVRATNGHWLPIRQPCLAGTDLRPQVEAACSASTDDNGDLMNNLTISGTDITDAQGRASCEPAGSTRRAQIRDAMAQIFNKDPYIIVD